jgi:hypothetical protein
MVKTSRDAVASVVLAESESWRRMLGGRVPPVYSLDCFTKEITEFEPNMLKLAHLPLRLLLPSQLYLLRHSTPFAPFSAISVSSAVKLSCLRFPKSFGRAMIVCERERTK